MTFQLIGPVLRTAISSAAPPIGSRCCAFSVIADFPLDGFLVRGDVEER